MFHRIDGILINTFHVEANTPLIMKIAKMFLFSVSTHHKLGKITLCRLSQSAWIWIEETNFCLLFDTSIFGNAKYWLFFKAIYGDRKCQKKSNTIFVIFHWPLLFRWGWKRVPIQMCRGLGWSSSLNKCRSWRSDFTPRNCYKWVHRRNKWQRRCETR